MNRLTFIKFSLALAGIAPYWEQKDAPVNIPASLLLGKGDPELVGSPTPLLKPVYKAFNKMKDKAALDGITIEIVSAYRSYSRQKAIWNRKYSAHQKAGISPLENISKIIEYSTLPGTSRHHWGTDLDIIDGSAPKEGDVLLTKKFHGSGPYANLRKWLENYAEDFGFIAPYTDDKNRKGFYYEPWHYSYAPIAKTYLVEYRKLDLENILKATELLGKDYLDSQFISRYVNENILGINAKLL